MDAKCTILLGSISLWRTPSNGLTNNEQTCALEGVGGLASKYDGRDEGWAMVQHGEFTLWGALCVSPR